MIVESKLTEVCQNAGLGQPANTVIKRRVHFKESGMSSFTLKMA